MSHHPRVLRALMIPTLGRIAARDRRAPPPIRWRSMYISALTAPLGPKMFLDDVAEVVLKGGVFSPSQASMGQHFRRDRCTVNRWVRLLVRRGWLQVRRRGRKLSNVYRLSRALWRRMTGRRAPQLFKEDWFKQLDLRMKARVAENREAPGGHG